MTLGTVAALLPRVEMMTKKHSQTLTKEELENFTGQIEENLKDQAKSQCLNSILEWFNYDSVKQTFTYCIADFAELYNLLNSHQKFQELYSKIGEFNSNEANTFIDNALTEYPKLVDYYFDDGNNLVTLAASKNNKVAMNILLSKGASPNAKNVAGRYAYQLTSDRDIRNLIIHNGGTAKLKMTWEYNRSFIDHNSLHWIKFTQKSNKELNSSIKTALDRELTISEAASGVESLKGTVNVDFGTLVARSNNDERHCRCNGLPPVFLETEWEYLNYQKWTKFDPFQNQLICVSLSSSNQFEINGGFINLEDFTFTTSADNKPHDIRWKSKFKKVNNFNGPVKVEPPQSPLFVAPAGANNADQNNLDADIVTGYASLSNHPIPRLLQTEPPHAEHSSPLLRPAIEANQRKYQANSQKIQQMQECIKQEPNVDIKEHKAIVELYGKETGKDLTTILDWRSLPDMLFIKLPDEEQIRIYPAKREIKGRKKYAIVISTKFKDLLDRTVNAVRVFNEMNKMIDRLLNVVESTILEEVKKHGKTMSRKKGNTELWELYQSLLKKKILDEVQSKKDQAIPAIIAECEHLISSEEILWKPLEVAALQSKFILLLFPYSSPGADLTTAVNHYFRSILAESSTKCINEVVKEHKKTIKEQLDKDGKSNEHIYESLKELIEKKVTQFIRAGIPTENRAFPRYWDSVMQLLEKLEIFLVAYKLGLPIYREAANIIRSLDKGRVIVVATSTGTGKSTGLPPLLFAASNYKKIVITQPRRFPCKLVSGRMCETFGKYIAGWEVMGENHYNHEQNPVLVCTDGLLKEKLVHGCDPPDIIILDEVHERSANIDISIALLAKLMKENAKYNNVKVILSSATMDPAVYAPFKKNGIDVECVQVVVPSPYQILEIPVINRNVISVVLDYYRKLDRGEQLLCFMASTQDVKTAVEHCNKLAANTLKACGLYASQSTVEQEKYLSTCSVFFSTTVAETSLTFPMLKYVIDTGKIMVPHYDPAMQVASLKEILIPESTKNQRRGRLGRTRPGEYIYLYNLDECKKKPFLDAQLVSLDLMDTEYQLLRLERSLMDYERYLPTPPHQNDLRQARAKLCFLNILTSGSTNKLNNDMLTNSVFGGARITRAMSIAVSKYDCGYQMLQLCAILMAFPSGSSSRFIKAIPRKFVSEKGDYMSILNAFEYVFAKKQRAGATFNVASYCKRKGFGDLSKILAYAITVHGKISKDLLSSFNKQTVALKRGNWLSISKCLLEAFPEMVFVDGSVLGYPKHEYIKYSNYNPPVSSPHIKQAAKLSTTIMKGFVVDNGSTMKSKVTAQPHKFLFAKDSVSPSPLLPSILSWVGILDESATDGIPQLVITRNIVIESPEEYQKAKLYLAGNLNDLKNTYKVEIQLDSNTQRIQVKGPIARVFQVESLVLNELIETKEFNLLELAKANARTTDIEKEAELNVRDIVSNNLFDPLRWRWANQLQAEVTLNQQTCVFTIKARAFLIAQFRDELLKFCGWLVPSCKVPNILHAPPACIKGIYPFLMPSSSSSSFSYFHLLFSILPSLPLYTPTVYPFLYPPSPSPLLSLSSPSHSFSLVPSNFINKKQKI